MLASIVTIALPIADRQRSYAFYHDGLGFDAPGKPDKDGVPEPLRLTLGDKVRIMLIPKVGFGWLLGCGLSCFLCCLLRLLHVLTGRFQILQLPEQSVVLRVAEGGAVEDVVLVVGAFEGRAKLAGETIDPGDIAAAVRPLAEVRGLDTIVLACTHFPLLAEELGEALPGVRFVDGGDGIARRIAWLTRDQQWPPEPQGGVILFTDGAPRTPLLSALARFGLTEVQAL